MDELMTQSTFILLLFCNDFLTPPPPFFSFFFFLFSALLLKTCVVQIQESQIFSPQQVEESKITTNLKSKILSQKALLLCFQFRILLASVTVSGSRLYRTPLSVTAGLTTNRSLWFWASGDLTTRGFTCVSEIKGTTRANWPSWDTCGSLLCAYSQCR